MISAHTALRSFRALDNGAAWRRAQTIGDDGGWLNEMHADVACFRTIAKALEPTIETPL